MSDAMLTVKVAELVEDFEVYPRNMVSEYNVSKYSEAMRSGANFPPIIVEKKTLRIVDGFTRKRALVRVFGPEHEIQVVARQYKSKKALLMEAGHLNIVHGQPLSTQEKVRFILMLQKLGASKDEIQETVCLTKDKIALLLETRTATSHGEVVELKRSMENLAGKKITKAQESIRAKASGHSQLFTVNQLIALLRADAIDWENEKVMEALSELRGLLDEGLARKIA